MCDQATRNVLEKIVREKIDSRAMFTALDITRPAKRQHGVSLRHHELKNDVHRIYADGQMTYDDNGNQQVYERQLVSIPGIPDQAYVYYPPGADPTTYVSDWVVDPSSVKPANQQVAAPASPASPQGISAATGGVSSLPTTSAPASQKKQSTGGYSTASRGRLWIPSEFLAALGVKSGDFVDVSAENSCLVLDQKGNATVPSSVITTVKVDRHRNITISAGTFQTAGLSAASYDILRLNNRIVIKKA